MPPPQFIAKYTAEMDAAEPPGQPASAPADTRVESVRELNRIFSVLDGLSDVLAELLEGWGHPAS